MSGGTAGRLPGRRAWLFAAKLALGLGLLALLCLWKDTGRNALQVLAGFQWHYVLLLVVMAQAMNLVCCIKWRIFLRHQGEDVSLWYLYGLYLIGKFFSNFLPSMVGGDVTRVMILGREIGSQSRSAASVFGERFTGLIAMIGVALVFSLGAPGIYAEPLVCVALAMSLALAAGILALLRRPAWIRKAAIWAERIPGGRKLGGFAVSLCSESEGFLRERGLMARTMAWSVVFHIMTGVFTYAAAVSIGFTPPLIKIIVITPLILMLNNLPVSPNNIGWWEWSFSVMLAQVGGTPAQGLGVALVLRAVSFVSALLGGLWFFVERLRAKPAMKG
jgi:uncharacterized protein (TIRG00374 family)